MNDVREAIERVGAGFDPPSGGLEDLARRRSRVRLRRRIAAGAFALTIAAGGSVVAVRAFLGSTPRSTTDLSSKIRVAATWPAPLAAPSARAAGRSECPIPSGDGSVVTLSSTSGPAGSSVDVSGNFVNGELWLQLWWNADSDQLGDVPQPPWAPTGPDLQFGPAGPGPVTELASVPGPGATGDCSFSTRFTVPNVEPGTYHVLWASGTANPPSGEDGYALYVFAGPMTFSVTG